MKKTRKKNPSRNYFTQETEDAILAYNNPSTTLYERDKLYSKYIHYPFFKLTQNIIHTFKFYHTEVEDLEHLQHEIEVFLLGKLHLYHHSKSINDRLNKIINKKHEHNLYIKGDFLKYTNNSDKITLEQIKDYIKQFENKVSDSCMEELKRLTPPKAYSYFGTITKRWLINYNTKNYSKKINNAPIDVLHKDNNYSYDLDDTPLYKDNLSNFIDLYVEYVTDNIYDLFPKSNDAAIADAILDLFRKRDKIEIFNKKALYFNIREKGDFKTPKITKIGDKLYEIFETSYIQYLDYGYINFDKTEI